MKHFVIVAGLFLAVLGVAIAGDSFDFTIQNKLNTTNSVTAPKANGFLEAIVVDVTGTTTQTLTFTSARTSEAILTVTTSADAVYRPRVNIDTITGTEVNVATNDLVKFLFVNDAMTVTCSETAATTNNTSITVITSEDK